MGNIDYYNIMKYSQIAALTANFYNDRQIKYPGSVQ